jgi:hypothetical protein
MTHGATADAARREQLLTEGFCRFQSVLSADLLSRLVATTDRMLAAQSEAQRAGARAQGSMLRTSDDPIFAELIALPAALEAFASMGWPRPTFTDGYIISKPPHSPRLFWHYDWFAWEDEYSYGHNPPQLFAMYYLSDTRRENGCLRVIPGSHIKHNALHDALLEPHGKALSEARDLTNPAFSDRPDEIDVCVNACDLLIGDARLLHASHENTTDTRRTLITLWYQPDFENLPERIQAQMVAKTQKIPANWPDHAKQLLEPLLPKYDGGAPPYGRSLYRRRETV